MDPVVCETGEDGDCRSHPRRQLSQAKVRVKTSHLTLAEVSHLQCLDVVEVGNPQVFGAGVLLWCCLFMEGDIKQHGVGDMHGSQQAKKGNKGNQHGVEGRVGDGLRAS